MNSDIRELKQAYHDAESRFRDAYRRAAWLEKRLYDADTDGTFNARLEELNRQESELENLALIATQARHAYAAADLAAR